MENSKIYKIIDNSLNLIYVGSTRKTLKQRLSQHEADYRGYIKGSSNYVTSFSIIQHGNYNIELIEEILDCENKDQIKARERFYIESLPCVNKTIVGRTLKEYYQDNKQRIKDYYESNKERILTYKNQKVTCPHCNSIFSITNKSHHIKTKKHINNTQ